ncbi:hypothetical protein [Methanoregula formicica]|uniref:hypothetical protein n=1 Tax=Methanoregula formicica TaxID=882104 RepID=UPI0018F12728|nr:hypothetical protein [Methanoregula formicica]
MAEPYPVKPPGKIIEDYSLPGRMAVYKYAREITSRPVADRQASAQQLLIRFTYS